MAKKAIYARLAMQGVAKNKQFYLPYLLTSALCVMLFYIINAIANDEVFGFSNGTVGVFMVLAGRLALLFSALFLFYTAGFVNRRRQKEFGVYSVLGMEKRHLARMLGYESLLVAVVSLAGGLLSGMLLGELAYMLLLRILEMPVSIGFLWPNGPACAESVLYFSQIFALILARNLFSLLKSDPIHFLQGGSVGEKEPRTRWGMAVLGLLTLGGGYGLALGSQDTFWVLLVFFFAVILVILGTYSLFTSGSIALLKMLRKNKSYYYHPRHFTGVANMLWRMKQNAAGLASICILCTAVLVTISTTFCLYVGMEDALKTRVDYDFNIQVLSYDRQGTVGENTPVQDDGAAVEALADRLLQENAAEPQNRMSEFMQRSDGRTAYRISFDTPTLNYGAQGIMSRQLEQQLYDAGWDTWITTRADSRQSFLEVYGSLLFMGVFFGLIFLIATVLIIYYKQVSEGYEDKKRFDILQKVGMTSAEVKSNIRSQVLTVFFLPLAAAAVHLVVALKPLYVVLSGAFGMANLPLFALVTASTMVVFGVIYVGVYALTARVYYKIIS